jgi:hypothetical protein
LKKAFIILTLLAAFNFASPNNQALSQTNRHVIEYTQEDKTRDLSNNEILKNKVVLYLKMQILMVRVCMINSDGGFNTS